MDVNIDINKLSIEDSEKSEEELKDIQECNADFRRRFIQLMLHTIGSDCLFDIWGGTVIKGVYKGINSDVDTICVESLESPVGVIPQAYLRMSDVIQFQMSLNDKSDEINDVELETQK